MVEQLHHQHGLDQAEHQQGHAHREEHAWMDREETLLTTVGATDNVGRTLQRDNDGGAASACSSMIPALRVDGAAAA